MINAIGIDSHTAAELTYPSLLVEKHLRALLADQKPAAPSSAMGAIEYFLRNATDNERRMIDPVASAVSYEIADSALRATHPTVSDTKSVLGQFLRLLIDIENERKLPDDWKQLAEELGAFLASLRLRGQGEAYSRLQSCV